MFGLITRLKARPGQRDGLAELLMNGMAQRSGCVSYVVARDRQLLDVLWVTEIWISQDAHREPMG